MAFRPYTVEELRRAAEGYGVNPDFAEAIYAIESSRGTNPAAMGARVVKRKRGGDTVVRGPLQVEDGTAADVIQTYKLGNVDVNDPDVHLEIALRYMKMLQDRHKGDVDKMGIDYLGRGTDELGTTNAKYNARLRTEMASIQSKRGQPLNADAMDAALLPQIEADPYGAPPDVPGSMRSLPPMAAAGGGDPMAAQFAPDDVMGIFPGMEYLDRMHAGLPSADDAERELRSHIAALYDDEMQGKGFVNA